MSVHRFGVIERFAFEIDVEPDEDAQGHAHLSMRAGGIRLGAADRVEMLDTLLSGLTRFLGQLQPAPPEFAGLSAAQLFDDMLSVLQDPHPDRPDYPWDRAQRYQRLQLLPNGCCSFDGEWAFLLCEPTRDRLIVRGYLCASVHEVFLDADEVASVARAVLRHPWRRALTR